MSFDTYNELFTPVSGARKVNLTMPDRCKEPDAVANNLDRKSVTFVVSAHELASLLSVRAYHLS